MTMHISIKNEDQTRVGNIQHWEDGSLQSCEQLLPGETASIYLHSTKYVMIEECEHKTTLQEQDNAAKREMVKIINEK